MDRSELEKCESCVKGGRREEIPERSRYVESKVWEWVLRDWPREVPRKTTWGQR